VEDFSNTPLLSVPNRIELKSNFYFDIRKPLNFSILMGVMGVVGVEQMLFCPVNPSSDCTAFSKRYSREFPYLII
jgi:hypothetical protein